MILGDIGQFSQITGILQSSYLSTYEILTAGTICKNWKGFDKDLFVMTVSNSERGNSKLYYGPCYKIAIAQWHDNKVNVMSTLGLSGKVNINRIVG